jgi:tetratricopeptide (TPR) repeat protein
MKTAKTVLAMLLLLACISLSVKAYGDFDLLDYFPAIIVQPKCNFARLGQMLLNYAQQAGAGVSANDKAQVLNYVTQFPEGKDPPKVVDTGTGYDVQITCTAAAFYVIGGKAVLQGNRQVALWCFCEAARRNPAAPIFLNNAAFVLVEFGYFADAQTVLKCAQSLAPDFNSVYVNLGAAQAGLGNFAAAAENYQKAYYNFPNNGEYLRLAAQAYKSAGMNDQAYIMGQLGLNGFPDLMDWNTFLASLNYPPPTPSPCANSEACLYDPNCSNFYLSLVQYGPMYTWANWSEQYTQTILNPALDNALAQDASCEQGAMQSYDACPPGDTCCHLRALAAYYHCQLTYACAEYTIERAYYAQSNAAWAAACAQATNNLNQMQGQLTPTQFTFLQCDLKNDIASQSAAMAQDEASAMAGYLQAILDANANVASTADDADYACSLADAYRDWLLTGHAISAFEPTFCLAILCFSYDTTSGTVGASVSFGPSIKLSYNPFKESLGLSVGLGLKIGAGPYNLGAAIWLKFSNSQFGVEPKANFGFNKVGYFLGFEQI